MNCRYWGLVQRPMPGGGKQDEQLQEENRSRANRRPGGEMREKGPRSGKREGEPTSRTASTGQARPPRRLSLLLPRLLTAHPECAFSPPEATHPHLSPANTGFLSPCRPSPTPAALFPHSLAPCHLPHGSCPTLTSSLGPSPLVHPPAPRLGPQHSPCPSSCLPPPLPVSILASFQFLDCSSLVAMLPPSLNQEPFSMLSSLCSSPSPSAITSALPSLSRSLRS